MSVPISWGLAVAREVVTASVPVVALESTVIAQGLPWPENLETALEMEAAVRQAGAIPATIAVLEGVARIGLSPAEIERIARSANSTSHVDGNETDLAYSRNSPRWVKANRRDLSVVLAQGSCAATTVSATLWLARRAGLRPCVMATGGLGGVHRGASQSFDVSTDLDELARADGAVVVCSGFKSILDLPATLECLETRGVAIVGYRTTELPAFTSRSSGLALEHRADCPAEAATIVRAHRDLGLSGAVVIVNPAPASVAIERQIMESALEAALQEAGRRGISGKALTPFLLDEIRKATGGRSLRANRALLVANARLAAEVAVALSQGDAGSGNQTTDHGR